MKRIGLILAGGESKRLFPWSLPKPLLEVAGVSLLEQAMAKLKGHETYVVTNANSAKAFKNYFKKKKKKAPKFLIEPEPRDTAAAVGFAVKKLKGKKIRSLTVLSADHYSKDIPAFHGLLKTLDEELTKFPKDLFVVGSTASTKDERLHSAFGWIVPKRVADSKSFVVERFVEKPKAPILAQLKLQGGLINSGIFFGSYDSFLEAYKNFYPEVLKKTPYNELEKQPIDRAIFEKCSQVRVVESSAAWEDLGTWSEVQKYVGSKSFQEIDAKENFVWCDGDMEVFLLSVENLAVIQCGKKVLVMPIEKSSDLKSYLEGLKENYGMDRRKTLGKI